MSMLFSKNQFGQNFHFFMICYFLEMFGMELKRMSLCMRQSKKYSQIQVPVV